MYRNLLSGNQIQIVQLFLKDKGKILQLLQSKGMKNDNDQ